MAVLDVTSLHSELEAAGLPVVGVSSDGRVDYARPLTPAEQTTAKAVIAAHDPAKRERDERTARETAKTYYTGLEAKGATVAQLQAQVASLAAVVEQMRVALGLGEPPDGRG